MFGTGPSVISLVTTKPQHIFFSGTRRRRKLLCEAARFPGWCAARDILSQNFKEKKNNRNIEIFHLKLWSLKLLNCNQTQKETDVSKLSDPRIIQNIINTVQAKSALHWVSCFHFYEPLHEYPDTTRIKKLSQCVICKPESSWFMRGSGFGSHRWGSSMSAGLFLQSIKFENCFMMWCFAFCVIWFGSLVPKETFLECSAIWCKICLFAFQVKMLLHPWYVNPLKSDPCGDLERMLLFITERGKLSEIAYEEGDF